MGRAAVDDDDNDAAHLTLVLAPPLVTKMAPRLGRATARTLGLDGAHRRWPDLLASLDHLEERSTVDMGDRSSTASGGGSVEAAGDDIGLGVTGAHFSGRVVG
ncbi:hypothetical protein GUJ93_ZPchr0013g37670 [Zizania palustris]|uniref:Uncharacterized protein n=1 Tax=Zizania palustris TaxID=103762 RepID=A0A8J6BT91_ZIZPA|nr:hypothetical protein GUJ93_ZPchr0013g37670 [Zizania palustris]